MDKVKSCDREICEKQATLWKPCLWKVECIRFLGSVCLQKKLYWVKHGILPPLKSEFGATIHRLLHKLHHVIFVDLRNFVFESPIFHLFFFLFLQHFDVFFVPKERGGSGGGRGRKRKEEKGEKGETSRESVRTQIHIYQELDLSMQRELDAAINSLVHVINRHQIHRHPACCWVYLTFNHHRGAILYRLRVDPKISPVLLCTPIQDGHSIAELLPLFGNYLLLIP